MAIKVKPRRQSLSYLRPCNAGEWAFATAQGALDSLFRTPQRPPLFTHRFPDSSQRLIYAAMESTNGTGAPLAMPFSIQNEMVLAGTAYAAFDTVGANFAGPNNTMFLWGLPFFHGAMSTP